MFLDAHSFPRATPSENCSLLGTDNVRGQISVHIFARNGDYCLFIRNCQWAMTLHCVTLCIFPRSGLNFFQALISQRVYNCDDQSCLHIATLLHYNSTEMLPMGKRHNGRPRTT